MKLSISCYFTLLLCSAVFVPVALLAQSVDTAFVVKPLKIDEEHPDPAKLDKAAVIKLVNWFIRGDCRKGVPAENFGARDPGLFPRMPGSRLDDCIDNYEYNSLLRKRLIELAGNWPDGTKQQVLNGAFSKGMDANMVIAIFGEPHRTHQISDKEDESAPAYMQWAYELGGRTRYIYFENGTAMALR